MPSASEIRADHVGSFLRPYELLEARRMAAKDPARLHALEDTHIRDVLNKQKELGFQIFTDGELRRRNFMSDFTDAVEGFDMGDAVARDWQAGQEKNQPVSSVSGVVSKALNSVLSGSLGESASPLAISRPCAATSWSGPGPYKC